MIRRPGFIPRTLKAIKLSRKGCANRPFFHIIVLSRKRFPERGPPIEQVGTYDPMPNEKNEVLTALNFERIQYWLGRGADVSRPVRELLGLAGFFPIHPSTYRIAWQNREEQKVEEQKAAQETSSNAPASS